MKVKNILTMAKLTVAGIMAFSSACFQVTKPGITTQKEEEKQESNELTYDASYYYLHASSYFIKREYDKANISSHQKKSR
jgi:hypothetical protein